MTDRVMKIRRREFLAATASLAAAGKTFCDEPGSKRPPTADALQRVADAPLLDLKSLRDRISIESMELLRKGGEFFVRVRSKDGLEGIAAANSKKMRETYPIFLSRVAPFFVGKDARRIESLLGDLYRSRSNYKLQGLAFWVCVAAAEIAILDLLGKASGQSIGELFGGRVRRDIPVYSASGNRGNRPQKEIEHLKRLVSETGAQAIKFRLGGRMSNNRDSLRGRTEALIPLVRREFGDQMTLYADSNSSYDVENAIRIGRLMEDNGYAFFEEPCPFDHIWDTKRVADKLTIPVAGGEQEFSMRRFRWAIQNRGVDIVQPDLHYFGGFIRCTRVARMAAVAGMSCTVHMSGAGLGYLYVLHFASYVPNAGQHQEFKGAGSIPLECATSDLTCHNGSMRVPSGPGFGVTIAADYLRRASTVRL
jgi:L-alanine-DL-glutamate epimerase-like enolase superfamily enzyme